MRNRKNLLLITAVLILTITAGVFLFHLAQPDSQNNTAGIYEYPITPDSEEWITYKTTAKMLEVCQIPVDLLVNMSTPDLAATVLDFPIRTYFLNIQLVDILSEQFNGLRELLNRDGAASALIDIYNSMPVYSSLDEVEELGLMKYDSEGEPYFYHIEYNYIDTLLAKFYSISTDKEEKDMIIEAVNASLLRRLDTEGVYGPPYTAHFYLAVWGDFVPAQLYTKQEVIDLINSDRYHR